MNNEKLEYVVEKLRELEGVTKKSSDKIAIDLINHKDKIKDIEKALNVISNDFGVCPICFYLTIDGVCPICSDETRDKNLICVVENMLDVMNVEQAGFYKGTYAVLDGEINLNKGIGPDKLHIKEIFNRTNPNTELILALDATYNGEVTANYIRDMAKKNNINYSKLARGIPLGGTLDYIDVETLKNALNNRRKDD